MTLLGLLNNIVEEKQISSEWNIGISMPMNKKGDIKECSNYRGITLTSIPGNVLTRILEKKLQEKVEITLEDTKHGFRKGRSTQDIIRQLREKLTRIEKEMHICFIDLEKTFNRVRRCTAGSGKKRYKNDQGIL